MLAQIKEGMSYETVAFSIEDYYFKKQKPLI